MQLHAAADGASAALSSAYRVESGGSLQCEWDPLIPFPARQLDQRVEIELAEDAALFWSDALMSGREARGERWLFERLSHELRLVRGGVLEYLERYVLSPLEHSIGLPWLAEEACYFGTAVAVGPSVTQSAAEGLHRELQQLGSCGAADLIGDGVVLVRLMAASGVAFHQARAMINHRLRA